MASIRPLFTITVLVVVGGYLYWKINEGPEHRPGPHRELEQRQDGVPPLAAAGGGATLAQDSAAPAWPPAASPPTVPALSSAASTSTPADASARPSAAPDAKLTAPEVPPIPDLPELPATVNAAPPVVPPIGSSAGAEDSGPKFGALPALPSMPGESPNGAPSASSSTATPAAPPVSTAPPLVPTTPPAASTPSDLPLGGSQPPTNAANTLNAPALTAQPTTPAPNTQITPTTAASAQLSAASDDRYGAAPASPAPSASITPTPAASSAPIGAGATFAASWPAIKTALDRNDLKQAHQLLSKWHGDESLSPADSQKVESLLGQLAGTLIYSTDTQLEPARVVKQNETLETIAKEYNVPWQLLAKINGVAASDQLRPGQQLKVVRGPFAAVVNLHRNELTLEIGGNYAGTFAVSVPPGTSVGEGQWLVDQKLEGLQGSFRPSTTQVTNDRTIILRDASGAAGTPSGAMLMIASTAAVGPPGAASLRVSPQDAEDLSDILSVGSRVVIRK